MSKQIDDLLEEQRKIRAHKAQVKKDLKNAQRRKARLKHKARLLSASDLASVLVLRQEEEAKVQTTKRRRSSQPATGAGQGSPNEEEQPDGDDDDEEEEAGSTADAPAQT